MEERDDSGNAQERPRYLYIDLQDAEWNEIDVKKRSPEGETFYAIFSERILEQPRAHEAFTDLYEASFHPVDRAGKLPRSSHFLLGPSGVGKTESVRVFTELLLGDAEAMTRLDASEYVEEHRVAQLLGAPPGYIRSNEFPMLSQYMLDLPAWQTMYGKAFKQANEIFARLQGRNGGKAGRVTRRLEELREERKRASGKKMSEIDHEIRGLQDELVAVHGEMGRALEQLEELRFKPGRMSYPSVLLIDEIEKAHDRLWNIVLQIMHGARLTTSFPQEFVDPQSGEKIFLSGEDHLLMCRTNFTNCYLFFTSNLGREEIESLLRGKSIQLGFTIPAEGQDRAHKEMSQKIYDAAMGAFRKRARSEFRGRVDHVLVYQPITEAGMRRKLDALLREVARELRTKGIFHVMLEHDVCELILKDATEHPEEGIRLLEKQVRRRVEKPLLRALRTGELVRGDVVRVYLDDAAEKPKVTYQYDRKTRARYAALAESGEEVILPRIKAPEAVRPEDEDGPRP